jgi:Protein of unknown function (DUF3716)
MLAAGLVRNTLQQAIYALPRRNIRYVYRSITWAYITSLRPSYINAILIQRAGTVIQPRCTACRRHRGLYLFPECRCVPGHFSRACGNCKWRNHASRYSCRDIESLDKESSLESNLDPSQNPPKRDRPASDGRVEVQIPYNPLTGISVVFVQH